MKNLTLLLALAMLTTQFVGCGCFRRMRDTLCRGAYCGETAPIVPRPGILTPQTVVAPTAPVVIPQASCNPCTPMVTCSPVCDPCCDPCSNGLAYPAGAAFGGCMECNGGPMYGGQVYDGQVIEGQPAAGGVTLPEGVFPGPAN